MDLIKGARHIAYLVQGININGFRVAQQVLATALVDEADHIGQAVTGHLGRPSPQPVQRPEHLDLVTMIMDQSASAKTMIITTPVKIADVMALSRTELISEWIGAP